MENAYYWAYHRATGPLMRLYIHIKKKKVCHCRPITDRPTGKTPGTPYGQSTPVFHTTPDVDEGNDALFGEALVGVLSVDVFYTAACFCCCCCFGFFWLPD